MSDSHRVKTATATCHVSWKKFCTGWQGILFMIVVSSQFSCSDPLFKEEIAQVSGTVTYQGKPLSNGRVTFHQTTSGTVIGGTLDDQGQYTLTFAAGLDVPAGSYQVTVRPPEIKMPIASEAPAETEEADQADKRQSPIPKKYFYIKSSDLKAEVVAGKNQFDFDLED